MLSNYDLGIDRTTQVGGGLQGLVPNLISIIPKIPTDTIRWERGAANNYRLDIGTLQGGTNIAATAWLGDVSELTVNNLPQVAFWVRLWYRLGNNLSQYIDIQLFPQTTNGLWDNRLVWDNRLTWSNTGGFI